MRRFLAVLTLLAVLLGGCSSSDEGDSPSTDQATTATTSTPTPGSSSASSSATMAASPYTLSITNFPEVAMQPGTPFNYQLHVTGPDGTSDHIGGHFSTKAVPTPTIEQYSFACNHGTNNLPGIYTVTCTAPAQAGTYYLRGHVRTGTGTATAHAWSSEMTFTVA
jgi:hypothetical protein